MSLVNNSVSIWVWHAGNQWTQKIIHLANMRQSPRQTTDFILKAEKQKGVAYRELLANLYQQLLEKCLTAADMNRPNYCPVNSSSQVAAWSVSLSSLPVCLHHIQISKAWGMLQSACFWISSLPPAAPNQHDQSAVLNQRFTLTRQQICKSALYPCLL